MAVDIVPVEELSNIPPPAAEAEAAVVEEADPQPPLAEASGQQPADNPATEPSAPTPSATAVEEPETAAPEVEAAPKKRGRGRPPGAKNKPKLQPPPRAEILPEPVQKKEPPPPPPSPRTQRRLAINQAAEARRRVYEQCQKYYLDVLSAELFLGNL